jgi:glutathione S-transferase
MIIVHHLGVSQSERIVWLLEELAIDYKLVLHTRDPLLSPDSLKSVPGNETGKAPFIEDSSAGITLSESGAIAEYIAQRYGQGRFMLQPEDKHYPDYLYWFHHANGTLFPSFLTEMFLSHAEGVSNDSMIAQFSRGRLEAALKHVDGRLRDNKWLAGDAFTLADIMTVYIVTTQRYWGPQVSLRGHDNLLRWLKDCEARPAYQRAMQKGDPEMKIANQAKAPEVSMMQAGGVESDHWKKK